MNEQLCALLDVLGEKNQLRHLFMYSVEWNEEIFAALVRFLEKSSKLIHLQLPDGNFTDAQYLQLLDVISKHNELLVRTDLGGTITIYIYIYICTYILIKPTFRGRAHQR